MGYGNCVLTLAAPENIEVVGEAGIPYKDKAELDEQLQRVLRDASMVNSYRQRAQERVHQYYDWEGVVDRYETLFASMAAGQTVLRDDAHVLEETAEGDKHESTTSSWLSVLKNR